MLNLTSVQRWSSKLDRFPQYRALAAAPRLRILQLVSSGEIQLNDQSVLAAIEQAAIDASQES